MQITALLMPDDFLTYMCNRLCPLKNQIFVYFVYSAHELCVNSYY